jgi:predicted RNA binding protein YcfA (HicA-like mRNA interferase family)
MKLPRGVSADRLIRALEQFGYTTIRQKGSHVRLFHEGPPAHSISVPLHNPLKIGTFHGILAAVAQARSISVQSIVDLLKARRDPTDKSLRYRYPFRMRPLPPWFKGMEPVLETDPELQDVLAELSRRGPIFHRPEYGTTRAGF